MAEILLNMEVARLRPLITSSLEGRVLRASEESAGRVLHLNLEALGEPAVMGIRPLPLPGLATEGDTPELD
jgi:hypothetical protein